MEPEFAGKGKQQGRLQFAGLWRLPHTVGPGGRKQEIDRRSVAREEAGDRHFQQIWERNLRLRGQSRRRCGGAATVIVLLFNSKKRIQSITPNRIINPLKKKGLTSTASSEQAAVASLFISSDSERSKKAR
ncbi:hypothetical protein BHM03_00013500 [Ensete ventricosum]|nr:hypothetical protein BHM03_00013500 [Ensete ventricosum]